MILVVGGAYQGKLEYVKDKYKISDDEIYSFNDYINQRLQSCRCINELHLIIKQMLKDGKSPIDEVKKMLINQKPEVVILNEIGNGIIPIEKSERAWREQVGFVGCYLAGKAESVERIVCGINEKVK